MNAIDYSPLNKLHRFRKICHVVEANEDYPFLFSLLGGACGTLFYLDDPIKGFVIFSWTILFIYVILIIWTVYIY